MHYIQTINCSAGRVRQRSDKILEIELIPDSEIDEYEAKEFIEIIEQISGSGCLILIDHRTPHSLSFNGMLILKQSPSIRALALLTNMGINSEIASFFKKMQPVYPVEIFYNKLDGLNWLQSKDKIKIQPRVKEVNATIGDHL